jgi:hypothetical protein
MMSVRLGEPKGQEVRQEDAEGRHGTQPERCPDAAAHANSLKVTVG